MGSMTTKNPAPAGLSPADPSGLSSAGEEAWEYYADRQWQPAARFIDHKDQRAHAIGVLAGLELFDRAAPGRAGRTLQKLEGTAEGFADLIIGMRAHHSSERDICARHIGRWLLAHDFYATWILERFTAAATATDNHALLFGVCAKFLKRRGAREFVAGPAVSAAHALGKHREAVALFRTYRELVDDPLLLQRAAFSLLHLGEHGEAEDLLVGLYRQITGRAYAMEPEQFELKRQRALTRVGELKGRPSLTLEEERDLGMSLLFLGKSPEALRVLEHSLTRATKRRPPTSFI